MEIELYRHNGVPIAEVTADAADTVMLGTPQDALDLFGSFFPEHIAGVIVSEANLLPEFFDLRTRLAGEILQKFVNYGVNWRSSVTSPTMRAGRWLISFASPIAGGSFSLLPRARKRCCVWRRRPAEPASLAKGIAIPLLQVVALRQDKLQFVQLTFRQIYAIIKPASDRHLLGE
jgi:hypothetical protein